MGRRKKKINKIKATILSVVVVVGVILSIFFPNFDANNYLKHFENLIISDTFSSQNVIQSTEITTEDNLKIYFLNVGQADSTFIVNGDNTMLIDAGNNNDGILIADYIYSLGYRKINYLIGTHPHEDHIGGLDTIIEHFEIENVLMPKVQTNTATFEDVLDMLLAKNLKITTCDVGDSFNLGDANCQIMSVENELVDNNLNLSSIAIRMVYGNQSFLFMGDLEDSIEKKYSWPQTNVLKVGHHGSNTSTSDKFLKEVSPKTAIISVGENNSYNHPHSEILDKLEKNNIKTYRTDMDGTILLTSDGTTNNIELLNDYLDGDMDPSLKFK